MPFEKGRALEYHQKSGIKEKSIAVSLWNEVGSPQRVIIISR